MDAIILQSVSKYFKKQKVLDTTSITFEKGKIHGIVGSNGSGKTVLFKIICGLLSPSEGIVKVNGCTVGHDRDFAPDTGIIIENPSFISFQSGFQNLKDLASISKKADEAQIKKAMQRVGLNASDRKPVSKYSMGMRQRLGIAQAIMENPSLLILDEPMNGLDKKGVKDIRELLLSLREEGKTILIASHYAEDIQILCDTVCEMEEGILTKISGW